MSEALRVGLVGAGPWAGMVHAPVLAAGPETALAGVWARRPEAAAELAGRYGAPVFEQPDDLYAACDAVAFAVPPDVQATMAIDAARAGKHLLLEKPIAADLDAAIRLAEAVDAAGVASMVVLSWRYSQAVRDFLDAAAGNGFSLLAAVSQKGIKTPVIFITGRLDAENEVRGLDLGAEDYLRKPLLPTVLLARVKMALAKRR
mgnify:CR=1 FL=1